MRETGCSRCPCRIGLFRAWFAPARPLSDSMPSSNADSTVFPERLFPPIPSKTLFAGDCTCGGVSGCQNRFQRFHTVAVLMGGGRKAPSDRPRSGDQGFHEEPLGQVMVQAWPVSAGGFAHEQVGQYSRRLVRAAYRGVHQSSGVGQRP